MKPRLSVATIVVVMGIVAGTAMAHGQQKKIPLGNWGGTGIAMEVTEQGATIEFDCAHAEILEPLALNSNNEFRAKGALHPEHGGPVRMDQPERNLEAVYSGKVEGDKMRLTIQLPKGEAERGPYTLTRNASHVLRKCR